MNIIFDALSFLFQKLRVEPKHPQNISALYEKTVSIYSIEQPTEERIKRSLSTKSGRDIVYINVIEYKCLGCSPVSSVPLWKIRVQYQKNE